jgi:starch synthase
MVVLHVSAECFPVAKVGGLADVVGALTKHQNKMGISSKVIMPYYDNEYTRKNKFDEVSDGLINFGDLFYNFQILKLKTNLGFELFMVKIPGLLDRENVYSYNDDSERFLSFQIAVLDWILKSEVKPDIIHCHDHHAGIIPFMLSNSFNYKEIKEIPTVLTIHNAQYQGQFSHDKIKFIPHFDFSKIGLLDWDGQVNPLAAGIKCAWRITTVSPGYMEELKINARGLEGLLRCESAKCSGILNGIDTKVWNPATDKYIITKYTEKTI